MLAKQCVKEQAETSDQEAVARPGKQEANKGTDNPVTAAEEQRLT
jgi:hypothetical protein